MAMGEGHMRAWHHARASDTQPDVCSKRHCLADCRCWLYFSLCTAHDTSTVRVLHGYITELPLAFIERQWWAPYRTQHQRGSRSPLRTPEPVAGTCSVARIPFFREVRASCTNPHTLSATHHCRARITPVVWECHAREFGAGPGCRPNI